MVIALKSFPWRTEYPKPTDKNIFGEKAFNLFLSESKKKTPLEFYPTPPALLVSGRNRNMRDKWSAFLDFPKIYF